MSENEKVDVSPSEGGESSDQSLSDSWTVLDSSHFKEDGDLSDAESVEVLASDELLVDDISQEDLARSGSSTASALDSSNTIPATPTPMVRAGETPAASPDTAADDAEYVDDDNQEDNVPFAAKKRAARKRARVRFLRRYWDEVTIKAFGDNVGRLIFEISMYSLLIDLVFLTFFGLSSLSCIVDPSHYSLLKAARTFQKYEMDPLSLQLSHVLSEWKKHPQEDHSLDRHLLKTLLLYFGGSTELSANLHALTERVQKHNEAVRHSGDGHDAKIAQHHRMVVSGHLAHSIACILGKQDNDRSLPAELFTTVNNSGGNSAFAPEPGFWLNDWHLPQYFKANDTYYRIDTKPVLPPMRNLFLHLGSAKWNHYFWKLYHQNEKGTNPDGGDGEEFSTNVNEEVGEDASDVKVSEIELEREETERYPLDGTSGGDLISVEESSGNVNLPDNPEERVGVLYPLFVNNLDLDEIDDDDDDDDAKVVDELDEKFEEFGNYYRALDEDKYFTNDINYQSKYDCLDGGCRQSDEQMKEGETLKKSKLGELFDGNFVEEYSENVDRLEEVHIVVPKNVDNTVSSETVKGKKGKTKGGKRKNKYIQTDSENMKGKSKLKNKNKRSSGHEESNLDGKRKSKLKEGRKNDKLQGIELKYIQLEENLSRERIHGKKRYLSEGHADWNTRMAQGREKLRALTEKGNDQIWVFERARARRDLREETFSE